MPTYQLGGTPTEVSPAQPELDVITRVRAELDGFYVQMRTFGAADPAEVFLTLAAMTARVSEVRSHIVRNESRRSQAFRTREVDPFLDECDRQFKYHSRAQSVRQMEADLTRGL